MSDQKSFSLLPSEIRQLILSFTDLVAASGTVLVRKGRLTTLVPFTQNDGTVHWDTCNCSYCSKPFVGLNILSVRNKSFREDAHLVLFSRNQLVFTHHPASFLSFLLKQQRWVKYIQDMYFTFSHQQIDQWITNGKRLLAYNKHEPLGCATSPPALDQSWVEMSILIRNNIPLDTLSITLDAWEGGRDNYIITSCDESHLPNVLDSYKAIIAPFRGWGQQGLRKFCVLWALFLDYEDKAEEEVMGDGYRASGKPTPDSRWF